MKTPVSIVRFVVCALVVFAGVRPAAAQQSAADRARLDDLAREAAREFAAATTTLPGQTRPTTPSPAAGAPGHPPPDEAARRPPRPAPPFPPQPRQPPTLAPNTPAPPAPPHTPHPLPP